MFTSVAHTCHPLLLLILTLTINVKYEGNSPSALQQYFEQNLSYCFRCFEHQVQSCYAFYPTLQYDNDKQMLNLLSFMLPGNTKRRQYWLSLKQQPNEKLIAKAFAQQNELNAPFAVPNLAQIKQQFLQAERLDGLQFCPHAEIDKFVAQFVQPKDELTVWLHMLVNVQPLLLPHLEQHGFPIPKTYAICGLTLFQANAGLPLTHYLSADFAVKLKIAQQLLAGVVKFAHGFNGYRIYLPDITADNVVYDAQNEHLTFVDLDSIYIVDSNSQHLLETGIHRHEFIECNDCFAYSADALCAHQLSDINLFAACQFLREDLTGNRAKGFLHPIPTHVQENHPQFLELLNTCIDCAPPKCMQRFPIVAQLLSVIAKI